MKYSIRALVTTTAGDDGRAVLGLVSAAVSVGYVTPDVVGMLGDPLDGSLINEVR